MSTDDLILSATNAWLRLSNWRMVRRIQRYLGRSPDIAYPMRYTDRMLWRKLVDRNPEFVKFSDKLATKDYIKRLCPALSLPRTLWVGLSSDDIPDELLRGDVFVKANHGSSFNFRTRGKPCDRAALRQMTAGWLAADYGVAGGEWPYAFVERKLFVEEAIGDAEKDLLEFNVRASDGLPILGSVIGKCKTPEQWVVYLDEAGTATIGISDEPGSPITPLPAGVTLKEPYCRAVAFTRQLSAGVDYARFDFFWNGTELFGGEITLFPAGGGIDPKNMPTDRQLCDGWDMRQTHFLKTPQTGFRRLYAGALRRRLERDRLARKNNHSA